MSLTFIDVEKNSYIKSLPESSVPSLEAPQCICKRGSLTVEAAVLLPFLATFFAFILFFFRVLQVQLVVQEALEETGRALAVVSEMELEETGETPAYFAMAKTYMCAKLAKDENINRYVVGDALGISLLTSEWEGDYLEIEANYAMKFPVNLLGRRYIWLAQKTSFRKWTGWHPVDTSKPSEIIVYITKTGTVYHKRRSCPYLSLSTGEVRIEDVDNLRNCSGGKYKECRTCGESRREDGRVYVTNYGDCYHYTLTCTGLKRTIYEKKLSEVRGKKSCSKCWK